MNIEVITQPSVEPVTDAEAFFHLKLTTDATADVSAEPQLLEVQRCIRSARERCEILAGRSFVQRTLRLSMNPMEWKGERRGLLWYMNGGASPWQEIELLRPPVVSVSSVSYYDDENALQTVDPANYFATSGVVPKLKFVESFAFPSTYMREDAIRVDYVAGYPATTDSPPDLRANVPSSYKSAVLIGVQLEFDELDPKRREALDIGMRALLSGTRVVTL